VLFYFLHDGTTKVCWLFDFPTLPDTPNHSSSLLKFPHHEFDKSKLLNVFVSCLGFPSGNDCITMKGMMWCFVIFVLER